MHHLDLNRKVAEFIMITKPGKSQNEVSSYWPVLSKPLRKLLLKRLVKPIIQERNLIPVYYFGLRENQFTLEQVHRKTNVMKKVLGRETLFSCIFGRNPSLRWSKVKDKEKVFVNYLFHQTIIIIFILILITKPICSYS